MAQFDAPISNIPSGPEVGHDPLALSQQDPFSQSCNRRRTPRYDVCVPVICYPLTTGLEVDLSRQWTGLITDISSDGVGLRLADAAGVSVGDLMLFAAGECESEYRFQALRVCNHHQRDSQTIVNASLDTPLRPLFSRSTLLPQLDRETLGYVLPWSEATLGSLEAAGAVAPMPLDTLLVCPDCHSLPTVRRGCGACLSGRTDQRQMIHHYACAHVDFVERFRQGNELRCPKCQTQKLIVGADFEYLNGPQKCLDCGQSDLRAVPIGHCLNCGNRFEMLKANELELTGYRVKRLDVMDFVRTT